MISRRFPGLMQNPVLQAKIITSIEQYIASRPKYHILKGRWYFSNTSNQWNFGNHLYLEIRSNPLINYDHKLYSETMYDFIMEICTPDLYTEDSNVMAMRLHNSVECNVCYSPYFVRVLPGPFVDALIERFMPLEEQEVAFLLGAHSRLGKESSVQKYVSSSLFDKNTIKLLFGFLEPAKKVQKPTEPVQNDEPVLALQKK